MVTILNKVEDAPARQACADFQNSPDALLEILHIVQRKNGFLSEAALRTIADALNISRAEIHGVVSFYHDFKTAPAAKQTIKICRAEACQAVGAEALITAAEKTFGGLLDEANATTAIESVFCLGLCASGPAVMIDERVYGRVDIERLKAAAAAHMERK